MSDVYRSVTNRSLGSNLVESIKSFLVGIVLFFLAFPILWWNEGCTDMSTVAKTAIVVSADGSGTKGEGALISVTGDLGTTNRVGDPEYLLPASHLALLAPSRCTRGPRPRRRRPKSSLVAAAKKRRRRPTISSGRPHRRVEKISTIQKVIEIRLSRLNRTAGFRRKEQLESSLFDSSEIQLTPATPVTLTPEMLKPVAPSASAGCSIGEGSEANRGQGDSESSESCGIGERTGR